MLRLAKGIVTAATILYSIPLLSWLLLRLWKGETWPSVGMLNAVGVWWFAPLLVLLPVALLVRARQASIMCAGILLAALTLFGAEFVPRGVQAAPDGMVHLRVLTFNALTSNTAFDAVAERILSEQPDIVALQELSPEMADALVASLGESYPYQALHPWPDPRGIGLLSRYPLRDPQTLDQGMWENWAQTTIVEVQGQALYLVNVHLWPIGVLDRALFARALANQHQQVATLRGLVEGATLPVLVVGDFNASPTNETYVLLDEQLDDAWRRVGTGPGFTFPAGGSLGGWGYPFLRIDYFWSRGNLTPLSVEILEPITGSDHLPLLGEFAVGPPSE